jgi:hypothetical protein
MAIQAEAGLVRSLSLAYYPFFVCVYAYIRFCTDREAKQKSEKRAKV